MSQPVTTGNTQMAFGVTLRRIICLGLVGGYLNAIGFIDLGGLYPAAMTGNTTQLGVAVVKLEWMRVFLIGSTVFCFFAGGMLSSYLQRIIVHPSLELAFMILLVATAQFVRAVTNDPVPWELPLLACSMAMQGETLSRFSGSSLQTIVVTNTLLKFADALVGRYVKYGKGGRTALGDVIVPGAAWVAYLIGAGLGVIASMFLQHALLPAIFLLAFLSIDVLAVGSRSLAHEI
ncbi:YoaK family protein [Aliirhizobium cellulosilyticum]|uniref:Uncharacterized membrane protein YoaK (UPF0700 family) n=1 Tax=Aliirhizobium cellulosilyticum TaxID=393664 RepID=A0A7W6XBY9_9HYPH|nr:YoaK family protein [Rhizobium cellulosilyticum]MBB4349385.1 uncharacterized membrane protein YoaK (UPF0700 family) [Rhizobium cellulosilyticum]MBB4412393.1 uncharacterized membrane protein YoaK (UPF0700 family) [Rhizobium cellulosilyticum]MBB4447025.1 uncharacterized membrane protein YoaK (UPF0700 family) [Rhizobium cellulosilyticum]